MILHLTRLKIYAIYYYPFIRKGINRPIFSFLKPYSLILVTDAYIKFKKAIRRKLNYDSMKRNRLKNESKLKKKKEKEER